MPWLCTSTLSDGNRLYVPQRVHHPQFLQQWNYPMAAQRERGGRRSRGGRRGEETRWHLTWRVSFLSVLLCLWQPFWPHTTHCAGGSHFTGRCRHTHTHNVRHCYTGRRLNWYSNMPQKGPYILFRDLQMQQNVGKPRDESVLRHKQSIEQFYSFIYFL